MFLLHVYIVAGRKTGVEKKKSDKGSGELCFTRQLIFFFESAEFACITVFLVVFFDQSTLTDVKLKKIKQLTIQLVAKLCYALFMQKTFLLVF